jgi:hypothetical protein
VSEDVQSLVKSIAEQLGETAPNPLRQIKGIIELCGAEFTQTILQEALKIEAGEGMMVNSGERRRTIGGVFFYLARGRMTGAQRYKIFGQSKKGAKTPPLPVFDWEKRLEVLQPLLEAKGTVASVKITLIGRPGKVEERKDVFITTVEHAPKETPLPKGVPAFPLDPTVYTVYMGAKQWRKVEEAIKDLEDALIIEGVCVYDPELPGMAIHAKNVTTLVLQQKQRDEQAAAKKKGGKGGARSSGSAVEGKPGDKPAARPKDKPPKKHLEVPTLPPVLEVDIPANAPPEVAERLRALHTAASTYRQKLEATLAKPEGERFGVEMTQKLLKTTEDQIKALEEKYS